MYDYIKSNQSVREFWEGKVAALRQEGLNDFDASARLADMLRQAYATQEAIEELTGLIDQLDIMLLDWKRLAAMLLGRDIEAEVRASAAPQHWSVKARVFPAPTIFRSPPMPQVFPAPTIREMNEAFVRFEAKEREYEQAIKRVKKLQQWVVLISLLIGAAVAVWLWIRAPSEFSWARVGASIVAALVVAFAVMLVPAWCVEQLRPKRKPGSLLDQY